MAGGSNEVKAKKTVKRSSLTKKIVTKKPLAADKVRAESTYDPATYRRLALALPDAVESSHMGAPDFRIDGRIFATLAYGHKGLGTLMLNAEQQEAFLAEAPEYFSLAPGGWGRMGMTLVRIDAPEGVLAGALSTAFHRILAKQSTKKVAGSKAKTRT